MSTPEETREIFINAAKVGRWDWIDQNLHDANITREDLYWAAHIADIDKSDDIRDLAATYWVVSSLPFEQGDEQHLIKWMMADKSEIVRLRLAIALYKRHTLTSLDWEHVTDNFKQALAHPELADVAAKFTEPA